MKILITGAGGFIGQELAAKFLAEDPSAQLVLSDVIQPGIPDESKNASRVTALKSDLTAPENVSSLLKDKYDVVYFLHGIMSGQSEAQHEFGMKVNFDSLRLCLDTLRKSNPGTKVVFSSSTAVFGPPKEGEVYNEDTQPKAQSSYGSAKHMIEILLNDYSRRGFLDGRIVRLPTVVVRPGAPSGAASSFASGMIREPMKGEKSILPVQPELEIWIGSPVAVLENLVKIKDVPKEKFGPSRVVNLPGSTHTVQELLDALEQVGGKEKRALIEQKTDPAIETIVKGWPLRFDLSKAQSLGLKMDIPLVEEVQRFKNSLNK